MWNIIIVVTLLTNLIVIPIELAFFYDGHTTFWIAFNVSSSVIFAIDIGVNFLSGGFGIIRRKTRFWETVNDDSEMYGLFVLQEL